MDRMVIHAWSQRTLRIVTNTLLAATVCALAAAAEPAPATNGLNVLRRAGWAFDRSLLEWYSWAKMEEQKEKGTLNSVAGWAEYDFEVPADGWYELAEKDGVPGWSRDVYLDGELLFLLVVSPKDDVEAKARPGEGQSRWYKEANLYLTRGKHTLRFRRLGFPGVLPSAWELRPGAGNPAACVRATTIGQNTVRAGTNVSIDFTGGTSVPLGYDLVVRNETTQEITPAGRLEFPAADKPVRRTVDVTFPSQGVFALLAKLGDTLLRPADLKAGSFIVIDTNNPPPPAAELKTTTVVDIDCVAQTLNGAPVALNQTYWEKDGATRVVEKSFGKYRESSGHGVDAHWATDGFSYKFDLPDCGGIYRLRVDYPDDTRRSMGFWTNDGSDNRGGITLTGGLETGDHYPLTQRLLTHEAFFYPRNAKGVVVAVLNLVPGYKAAATRIRIDRVDPPLPAAPLNTEHRPLNTASNGRSMGFYFEENGRWTRFFGGNEPGINIHLTTLDRWGQWNRYLGANLMYPTINVYQGNHYPSRILDGYFSTTEDETRMVALMAEKYGCRFVPEFHLSGQAWFDKHVMGVWAEEKEVDGKKVTEVKFRSPAEEEYVIRNRDGGTAFGWKAAGYNALHPKIQAMYISVFGELADRLKDCESFAGISSRLMLGWQWQGWNAIPSLNWGYDDWTVAQFEKDTGIKVPGVAGSAERFRQRFDYLTGAQRERWMDWRCQRLFDYHRRLRNRVQQAKPGTKLFFTYFGPDPREAYAPDILGQMREIGMDPRMYAGEPGMVIIQGGGFGRRFSTPVADAAGFEPLFDDGVKTVARLGDRGFSNYSAYYEVNDNLDWTKLGGKKYCAFDACVPSGINERELYAIALADSDTSFFLTGGNGWVFGTPSLMQPFLREYRALPAQPFVPFVKATDPVAVWHNGKVSGVRVQGSGEKDTGHRTQDSARTSTPHLPPSTSAPEHRTLNTDHSLFFYAVNRLPVPVTVTLTLKGIFKKVFPAAGGEALKLTGNDLAFTLEPFMLRSFRATGWGVELVDCRTGVPADYVAGLQPLAEFAKSLREELAARRVAVELSDNDAKDAVGMLDEALQAFAAKRYWRAKANLERIALVRIYDLTGHYPPGLFQRAGQHGLVDAAQAPIIEAAGENALFGDARGRLDNVVDIDLDRDGNLWATSGGQLIQVGRDGQYRRNLHLTLPHKPFDGDARWSSLANPNYLDIMTLRTAPDGRLCAMRWDTPPMLFETALGRVTKQGAGYGFPLPGERAVLLAFDPQQNAFLAATQPPERQGVYKYHLDGSPAYDFGSPIPSNQLAPFTAAGGAFDRQGRMYLAAGDKGLRVYAADGKELEAITDKPALGLGRLAVAADGQTVMALAPGGGYGINLFQRTAEGKLGFQRSVPTPARTNALVLTPDGSLILGLKDEYKGAVAQEFRIGEKALEPGNVLVRGLREVETRTLNGFTQLQVHDGKLYYGAHGKLLRLTPGAADAEIAFDPGFPRHIAMFEAFAFAPDGDLYLASHWQGKSRGVNVYRCRKGAAGGWEKPEALNDGKPLQEAWYMVPTDLAVDAQGRLIVRFENPDNKTGGPTTTLYRYSPADGKRELLLDLGPTRQWGDYGLHIAADGRIYIAGGGTAGIWCLAPDGKVLWETKFDTHQGDDSTALRQPLGITTDSKGRVWVTEPARNHVLCLSPEGTVLKTYGRFGTMDDRDGLSFCQPVGIAALKDAAGCEWMYIADVRNQRLVKWRLVE